VDRTEDTVNRGRALRVLGLLLFAFGILLGMALSGAAIWSDLEAEMFDASLTGLGGAQFRGLSCPVLITAAGPGTVTANVKNPLDRPVELKFRVHFTQGFVTLIREEEVLVPLDPGERARLQWTVNSEDAAWGRFILVKIYSFPRSTLRAELGSCGILVLDIDFLSGNQALALTLAASLLGMAGGLGLCVLGRHPADTVAREVARALLALALAVVVTVVVSLLGSWLPGTVLFFGSVLLIGAVVGHYVR
jgi:hypothetical protein